MRVARLPLCIVLLQGWSSSICGCHSLSLSSNNPSKPSNQYGDTTRNIATQVLQGAGPASVDMNDYNLPIDVIENEWTAMFVQKVDENVNKAYLTAKTNDKIFADYITYTFPRKLETGGSLGIQLKEIAGDRDDGLGITVVEGLVPNGSADDATKFGICDIMPGDSLTKIAIIRRSRGGDDDQGKKKGIQEKEQIFSVITECLSYDSTVEQILSLPSPPPATTPPGDEIDIFEDYFQVTIKRLRRRPKIKIKLQYPPNQINEETGQPLKDTTIELDAGENLRQGMLIRGVKLNDPLAKRFDTKSGGNCGAGGLCRTCSVVVVNGGDLLNPQRVAEQQMLADSPRWRLACKAIVGFGMKEGEMTIRVNPRQWD